MLQNFFLHAEKILRVAFLPTIVRTVLGGFFANFYLNKFNVVLVRASLEQQKTETTFQASGNEGDFDHFSLTETI